MKALTRRLAVLGVLGLAVACAAPPAPPPPTSGTPADEAALRAMGSNYAVAWNKGDVATLITMVTDDYEAIDASGTTVKGKAAFEAREKESVTMRAGMPMTLTVNTGILKWAGADHATIGGTWTMAGLPPGSPGEKGAWNGHVVKGADGQWRLATGLVAEFVPPPPPPPTPAKGKGGN